MRNLIERYQAMPDELLLKTLAEREKYNEEAVTVAIAEANARGLVGPEVLIVSPSPNQKNSWLRGLLQAEQIGNREGEGDDLLGWSVIREEETVSNKLALKLMLLGFVLLIVFDLWVQFRYLLSLPSVIVNELNWIPPVLAGPVLIDSSTIVGLLKRLRPAFYLGAGLITLGALGWFVDISSLFISKTNSNYMEYHIVYSWWFVSKTIELVILIGTGWLLCQRVVYKEYDMTRISVPLAFLFGGIGLGLFKYSLVILFRWI
jgi:hypothetical protein